MANRVCNGKKIAPTANNEIRPRREADRSIMNVSNAISVDGRGARAAARGRSAKTTNR